jgi:uncharacterized protein YcnI
LAIKNFYMKKYLVFIVVVLVVIFPSIIFAHSTVSPSQTSTSKYETFTLSVPTEKEVPTTSIKLVVPAGIDRFTPFVKPGWTIVTKKNEQGNVTEIEWRGGAVPASQKDIFQFTARTAAESTSLIWKVYQTYQDGEVVSWDQDPKSGTDIKNPYSITEVKADSASAASTSTTESKNDKLPLILSIAALGVSLLSLRPKK